MNATLKFSSNVLAFADAQISSNPARRHVDWSRTTSASVENPEEFSMVVAPNSAYTVFDGTIATGIDAATEFLLSISTLSNDRYRLTWTGIGAAPAFRTDRVLAPNGKTYSWIVNSNQTVSLTSDDAGDFAAVVAGDTLFIPGSTTGDPVSPFNALNEGEWLVLSKDGTSTVLQLARPVGVDFSAYGEITVATSNDQLLAYSAAGVQAGDVAAISDGFSVSVQKTYIVQRVTPEWFEIISTSPLPVAEIAVPSVSGMAFYLDSKRFLKIEVDQEAVIRLNGDTGNTNQLSPWVAGSTSQVAEFIKVGPVWSLVVVNKSAVPMNLLVISAS